MVTNNKFIVERTNVLAADVTVGTSYAALDEVTSVSMAKLAKLIRSVQK
jgi:hypothetical protein